MKKFNYYKNQRRRCNMRIYETYRQSSDESTIIFKKQKLSEKEASIIKRDIKTVNKLEPVQGRIKGLRDSYEKFQRWERNDNEQVDEEIVITDYIIKTVQFVDQWESFIKREYENINFKFMEEKRKLYEGSFEYRLIYNLRNMISHTHQPPYTQVMKSIEKPHEIVLDVEYLLEVHTKIQGSFKEELINSQIKSINLVEMINSSFPKLIRFHESVSIMFLNEQSTSELTNAAYKLLKFYNKHQEENGALGLTNDEINVKKINNPDYNQTLKLTEVPYGLANFIALSSNMTFRIKGQLEKEISSEFPLEKEGIIYIGANKLTYMEVEWIKVAEHLVEFSKDKSFYSCMYMINGLKEIDYERKKREFIKKEQSLISQHFYARKKININHDDEIIIIYFRDETGKDLEVVYSGTVDELQRNHLGDKWEYFNLGDSFHLGEEKVRVFSKSSDILSLKARYFIGPNEINSLKINYKNLSLDRLV